jgi:hypothetical protein
VAEHQEFGILGYLTPGQHRREAEQTAHEQAGDREDPSAVISVRKTPPARPDRVIEPYRSPLRGFTSASCMLPMPLLRPDDQPPWPGSVSWRSEGERGAVALR